jgi:uncharacterized protein (TIGR00255 family)
MISSMTAFARADTTDNFGELCWELRSVNHRYLEASFRLPETLRSLEPELRDTLRGQLGRGKLDCWLKVDHAPQRATPLAVDEELVGKLIALVEELSKRSHNVGPADALELLRFPGVIVEPTLDVHQAAPLATELFATALADLKAQREREGGKLAELVRTRLVAGTEIVGEMRILTSDSSKSHRDRLMSRLQELLSESQGVNPERLEQEVAFLAQKSDISEELDRLDVHLEEARHVIAQGGPAGRRLDFLMQELNREANTVGAKSVLAEMSKLAVDLKVLIEQAREQIQNIE